MSLFDFFETFKNLQSKVKALEEELVTLKKQKEKNDNLIKSHFTRLKSNQELSQLMIQGEVTYADLSPRKAIEIYRDQDRDFIILDITEEDDPGDISLDGTQHIPFSELKNRYDEIPNKAIPLLVISKKGLNSILACEFLSQQGFLNVNNVSGGYILWGRSDNSLFKVAV